MEHLKLFWKKYTNVFYDNQDSFKRLNKTLFNEVSCNIIVIIVFLWSHQRICLYWNVKEKKACKYKEVNFITKTAIVDKVVVDRSYL